MAQGEVTHTLFCVAMMKTRVLLIFVFIPDKSWRPAVCSLETHIQFKQQGVCQFVYVRTEEWRKPRLEGILHRLRDGADGDWAKLILVSKLYEVSSATNQSK